MAEYNVNNGGTDLSQVDNTPLKKAIEAMRANYSDETRNEVVTKAVFDSTFFVPAQFDNTTELMTDENDRLEFNERPKAQFILIESPDGDKFIPAFTSHDGVIAFREEQKIPCEAFLMTFADIVGVLESQSYLQGFVVDPSGYNLPFPTPFVMAIKQKLVEEMDRIENQQAQEGRSDITMTTKES